MDELGTVRTSKIRFQGSAIGGNPSDNDWRIEVVNEGLQFQQYDPGASPAGYITRQIFGRGKSGVTVTPSSTYNISGKLKLSGGLLLQEIAHQTSVSSHACLYPNSTDKRLYYLHPNFNEGNPYDLTNPTSMGDEDSNIRINRIDSTNENIIMTLNSIEKFRILEDGNVGIGVTNPLEKLQVEGNIRANMYKQVIKVTRANQKFYLDGIERKKISLTRGNTYVFDLSDPSTNNYPFYITTSSTGGTTVGQYLTGVTGNGNHFGTTNKEVTFVVGDNAPGCLYYQSTTYENVGNKIEIVGGGIRDSDNDTKILIEESLDDDNIHLITQNVKRLTVEPNGNVGIGVTTTDSKLEVNGSIKLKGHFSGYNRFTTDPNSSDISYVLPKNLPNNNKFLRSDSNGVLLWDSVGEVNVGNNLNKSNASNVGIYKEKNGVNLNFKSLIAGDHVNLLPEDNSITISTVSKPDEIFKSNSRITTFDEIATGKHIDFFVDGTRNMVVRSNAVGIGITNPTYSLHVLGDVKIEGSISTTGNHTVVTTAESSTQHLSVSNNGSIVSAIINQNGGQDVAYFSVNNQNKMKVLNTGNIAIGKENAEERLEVQGGIRLHDHVDSAQANGIIEFNTTSGDFLGRKGGEWVSLTVQGEKNTASNVGSSGEGIFDSKVGDDIKLKKIEGSDYINVIATSNNTVKINSSSHNNIVLNNTSLKMYPTYHEFKIGNVERMRLDNTGLGVGKISSAEKLELDGAIVLSKSLGIADGTIEYDSTNKDFYGRRDGGKLVSLTTPNQIVLYDSSIKITDSGSNPQIHFVADFDEKMNINNIGVGVGSPATTEKFEVAGGLKVSNAVGTNDGTIQYNSSSKDFLGRKDGKWVSFTQNNQIILNNSRINIAGAGSDSNIDFSINDQTIVNINQNGLGIGTTSVNEKLEINGGLKIGSSSGTVDGTIQYNNGDFEGRRNGEWVSLTKSNELVVNDSSINLIDSGNDSKIKFRVDGNEQINLDKNGVGIGITSTVEKLEINGAIKIGDTSTTNAENGVIKFTGTDLLCRKNDEWVSLLTSSSSNSNTANNANTAKNATNANTASVATTALTALKMEANNTSIVIEDNNVNPGKIKFKVDDADMANINNIGLGIGRDATKEKLEINGAIKLGDSSSSADDGTIRYYNNDFWGKKNGQWHSLTLGASSSSGVTTVTTTTRATNTNTTKTYTSSSNYGNYNTSMNCVVLSDLNKSLTEGDHHILLEWSSKFIDSPLDDQELAVYYKNGSFSSSTEVNDGTLLGNIYRSSSIKDQHTNSYSCYLNVPSGSTYNIRYVRKSASSITWGSSNSNLNEEKYVIDYVAPPSTSTITDKNVSYTVASNYGDYSSQDIVLTALDQSLSAGDHNIYLLWNSNFEENPLDDQMIDVYYKSSQFSSSTSVSDGTKLETGFRSNSITDNQSIQMSMFLNVPSGNTYYVRYVRRSDGIYRWGTNQGDVKNEDFRIKYVKQSKTSTVTTKNASYTDSSNYGNYNSSGNDIVIDNLNHTLTAGEYNINLYWKSNVNSTALDNQLLDIYYKESSYDSSTSVSDGTKLKTIYRSFSVEDNHSINQSFYIKVPENKTYYIRAARSSPKNFVWGTNASQLKSEDYTVKYITVPVVTTTTTTVGGGGTTVTTTTRATNTNKTKTYTTSSNYGNYTTSMNCVVLTDLNKSLTEGDHHILLEWSSKFIDSPLGDQELAVYYKNGSFSSSTEVNDGTLLGNIYRSSSIKDQNTNTYSCYLNVPSGSTYNIRYVRKGTSNITWGSSNSNLNEEKYVIDYVAPPSTSTITDKNISYTIASNYGDYSSQDKVLTGLDQSLAAGDHNIYLLWNSNFEKNPLGDQMLDVYYKSSQFSSSTSVSDGTKLETGFRSNSVTDNQSVQMNMFLNVPSGNTYYVRYVRRSDGIYRWGTNQGDVKSEDFKIKYVKQSKTSTVTTKNANYTNSSNYGNYNSSGNDIVIDNLNHTLTSGEYNLNLLWNTDFNNMSLDNQVLDIYYKESSYDSNTSVSDGTKLRTIYRSYSLEDNHSVNGSLHIKVPENKTYYIRAARSSSKNFVWGTNISELKSESYTFKYITVPVVTTTTTTGGGGGTTVTTTTRATNTNKTKTYTTSSNYGNYTTSMNCVVLTDLNKSLTEGDHHILLEWSSKFIDSPLDDQELAVYYKSGSFSSSTEVNDGTLLGNIYRSSSIKDQNTNTYSCYLNVPSGSTYNIRYVRKSSSNITWGSSNSNLNEEKYVIDYVAPPSTSTITNKNISYTFASNYGDYGSQDIVLTGLDQSLSAGDHNIYLLWNSNFEENPLGDQMLDVYYKSSQFSSSTSVSDGTKLETGFRSNSVTDNQSVQMNMFLNVPSGNTYYVRYVRRSDGIYRWGTNQGDVKSEDFKIKYVKQSKTSTTTNKTATYTDSSNYGNYDSNGNAIVIDNLNHTLTSGEYNLNMLWNTDFNNMSLDNQVLDIYYKESSYDSNTSVSDGTKLRTIYRSYSLEDNHSVNSSLHIKVPENRTYYIRAARSSPNNYRWGTNENELKSETYAFKYITVPVVTTTTTTGGGGGGTTITTTTRATNTNKTKTYTSSSNYGNYTTSMNCVVLTDLNKSLSEGDHHIHIEWSGKFINSPLDDHELAIYYKNGSFSSSTEVNDGTLLANIYRSSSVGDYHTNSYSCYLNVPSGSTYNLRYVRKSSSNITWGSNDSNLNEEKYVIDYVEPPSTSTITDKNISYTVASNYGNYSSQDIILTGLDQSLSAGDNNIYMLWNSNFVENPLGDQIIDVYYKSSQFSSSTSVSDGTKLETGFRSNSVTDNHSVYLSMFLNVPSGNTYYVRYVRRSDGIYRWGTNQGDVKSEDFKIKYVKQSKTSTITNKTVSYTDSSNYGNYDSTGNAIVIDNLNHTLSSGEYNLNLLWNSNFNQMSIDNQLLDVYYKDSSYNSSTSVSDGIKLRTIYRSYTVEDNHSLSESIYIKVPENKTYYIRATRSSPKNYRWGNNVGELKSESYAFKYITVPVVTTTTTTGGGGGTTVTTITTAKHSSKDANYTISSNYGDYVKSGDAKVLSNLDKSLTEGDYHVFLTWNSKTNEQMFGNQKLNVYYKDGSYSSSTSASDGILINTLKRSYSLTENNTNNYSFYLNVPSGKTYSIRFTRESDESSNWGSNNAELNEEEYKVDYVNPPNTSTISSKNASYTSSGSNYGNFALSDTHKVLTTLDNTLTSGDYNIYLLWNSEIVRNGLGNQVLEVYYKNSSFDSATSATDGTKLSTIYRSNVIEGEHSINNSVFLSVPSGSTYNVRFVRRSDSQFRWGTNDGDVKSEDYKSIFVKQSKTSTLTTKTGSYTSSSNYGNYSGNHIVLSNLSHNLSSGDYNVNILWDSEFNENPLGDQVLEVYYKDGSYSSESSVSDGTKLRTIYRSNIIANSQTYDQSVYLNVPSGSTYYMRFIRKSLSNYRWGNNVGELKKEDYKVNYITVPNKVTTTTTGGSGSAVTNSIYQGDTSIIVSDTGSDGHVKFSVQGSEKMRLSSSGYLGIGSNSPTAPLHIAASVSKSYSGVKVDGNSGTYAINTGILCDNDCVANMYYYNSDKRIKKEITENNMKNSLEKINMLESVNYKYHNDKKMVGFIGQNVRKVIPEAVSFSEQYVYTIDKMIKFRNYQGRTLMTFDSSHGLNNNRMHGELVQPITLMIMIDDLIKYVGVNVILSERDVLLDVNLENEYNIEKEVYVAGPKIKDFHVINEQPIISMCVSAIQELTEQCKELQETNRLLINEINSLKSFN